MAEDANQKFDLVANNKLTTTNINSKLFWILFTMFTEYDVMRHVMQHLTVIYSSPIQAFVLMPQCKAMALSTSFLLAEDKMQFSAYVHSSSHWNSHSNMTLTVQTMKTATKRVQWISRVAKLLQKRCVHTAQELDMVPDTGQVNWLSWFGSTFIQTSLTKIWHITYCKIAV